MKTGKTFEFSSAPLRDGALREISKVHFLFALCGVDHPQRVNASRQIEEEGQQQVEPEHAAESDLQKDSQRREERGDDHAPEIFDAFLATALTICPGGGNYPQRVNAPRQPEQERQ